MSSKLCREGRAEAYQSLGHTHRYIFIEYSVYICGPDQLTKMKVQATEIVYLSDPETLLVLPVSLSSMGQSDAVLSDVNRMGQSDDVLISELYGSI